MNTPKKAPKEGTKSEKQIWEANVKTLRFYKLLFGCIYAFYFAITLCFFWSSFTARYITLSTGCFLICATSYKFMSYMSTPTYATNERGVVQLTNAGLDLNIGAGGLAEHAKDAIIVCCIVTLLSLLHPYFWFLLLVIPIRLFHLLWIHILAPWIFSPGQEPQVNEKKQKKMERKMRRTGHLMHTASGRSM